MNTDLRSCRTTQPLRGACRRLLPILVALAFGGASAQPAGDAALAREFDEAFAAYERNQWPEVFQAMSALAARGHPEAARISLQMWRYGPSLYGRTFTASSAQLERWTRLWGCAGDATGSACDVAMRSP